MIRKKLKRYGQSLSILYIHWTKCGNLQILFPSRGGFIKTSPSHFKFRGPTGSVILFVGSVELCIEGGVNNIG